jgi:uncharacterized protein (TIGR03084 family)
MAALCADLTAECEALHALTTPLDADGWRTQTRFFNWSIYDEVAHLCYFDEVAVLAARNREAFRAEQSTLDATRATGIEISEFTRRRYVRLDGPALAAFWRQRYTSLAELLGGLDPKTRLPWFGPDMSARSFVTARLMETWAHGQDVYDALGLARPATGRLRHIAHLGFLTFGWSFSNRGLTPPAATPYVELTGPAGERWVWGAPGGAEFVRGTALDFCLVVAQRRNVADTRLEVAGATAREWMRIAQCFAGPPATGPAAGTFPL